MPVSQANARYPLSLSPFAIGSVELRNRVFMPAHGNALVVPGPAGTKLPSEDLAHYFAERAAGGTGLLVHSINTGPGGQASALYADSIPSFRSVAELTHRGGAKIFGQIFAATAGNWGMLGPQRPTLGPSATPIAGSTDVRHEMESEMLDLLVDAYGQNAVNLAEAGYDGIEIHAAHGQIIEQFISPYFNRREDDRGGSFERRLRFLVDILQRVRRDVGALLPVGLRLNGDEMIAGGLARSDSSAILEFLVDESLVDFVNLDSGISGTQTGHFIAPSFTPPLHQRDVIEAVGAAIRTRVATMAVPGRVTTLAEVEELLADGIADMVGSLRGLLAEPELVRNAAQGREDRNRVCIACNVCYAAYAAGSGSYCAINPASSRERLWGVASFAENVPAKRTVVVGAGPAGLEAARVLASLGHEVVVFERSSATGGHLARWATLPNCSHLASTVAWYDDRLDELGVTIKLDHAATRRLVEAESPDAVIVATGSTYSGEGFTGVSPFPIPGSNRDFVFTPERVLAGDVPQGTVLVVDDEGFHAGPGLAQLLAEKGAQVELATAQAQIASNLTATLESGFVIRSLRASGVTLTTGVRVDEIADREVVLAELASGTTHSRKVDAVVLATRRLPDVSLVTDLRGVASQVFVVGDALAPRGLAEAVFEGHRFARMVGQDAAATTVEALFAPPDPVEAARPAAAVSARAGAWSVPA
jgi:2,4-dienoyl-CoA reductase-like NADH-dependent reductase (Old Yellow Enzyme family)/thioredoxin reductase